MSSKEQFGKRDLCYSFWHRRNQIIRFLESDLEAYQLGMIDIDGLEYCVFCYQPLAIIELAVDNGQAYKTATVSMNLGNKSSLPVFVVFYTINKEKILGMQGNAIFYDIDRFRIQQIAPTAKEEIIMTPEQYAKFLLFFRQEHKPFCPKKPTV